MARTSKRRPVPPQDEVMGFFQQLGEMARRYKSMVVLGVGGIILLLIGVSLTTYLQNRRRNEARAALAQVRPLVSKPESAAEAVKGLDQLLKNYPHTPSAKEALIFRAHLLFQLKKYAEASQAYEAAAKQLDDQENLAPLIAENLSYCYEALGDFNRAAQVLAPGIDKSTGPLKGEMMRRAAWLYEKSGNTGEAARYWRKLLENPPTPALVPYLKEKLAAAGPAAEKAEKPKP